MCTGAGSEDRDSKVKMLASAANSGGVRPSKTPPADALGKHQVGLAVQRGQPKPVVGRRRLVVQIADLLQQLDDQVEARHQRRGASSQIPLESVRRLFELVVPARPDRDLGKFGIGVHGMGLHPLAEFRDLSRDRRLDTDVGALAITRRRHVEQQPLHLFAEGRLAVTSVGGQRHPADRDRRAVELTGADTTGPTVVGDDGGKGRARLRAGQRDDGRKPRTPSTSAIEHDHVPGAEGIDGTFDGCGTAGTPVLRTGGLDPRDLLADRPVLGEVTEI